MYYRGTVIKTYAISKETFIWINGIESMTQKLTHTPMDTWFLIKNPTPYNGKYRTYLQQIVLVKLDVCMYKNANKSIFVTMHIAQVIDQRSKHKTRYIKSYRRVNGNTLEHIVT